MYIVVVHIDSVLSTKWHDGIIGIDNNDDMGTNRLWIM